MATTQTPGKVRWHLPGFSSWRKSELARVCFLSQDGGHKTEFRLCPLSVPIGRPGVHRFGGGGAGTPFLALPGIHLTLRHLFTRNSKPLWSVPFDFRREASSGQAVLFAKPALLIHANRVPMGTSQGSRCVPKQKWIWALLSPCTDILSPLSALVYTLMDLERLGEQSRAC